MVRYEYPEIFRVFVIYGHNERQGRAVGLKFGGTEFSIGIVDVAIGNLDTDKYTGSVTLTIPIGSNKISIKAYSGTGYRKGRTIELVIRFMTPEEPWPEEDEEEDDQENA